MRGRRAGRLARYCNDAGMAKNYVQFRAKEGMVQTWGGRVLKDIKKGEEIFVSYGDRYWITR
jgi:SET domain-containing protein